MKSPVADGFNSDYHRAPGRKRLMRIIVRGPTPWFMHSTSARCQVGLAIVVSPIAINQGIFQVQVEPEINIGEYLLALFYLQYCCHSLLF